MSGIRVEIQLADKSFTSGLLRAGQSLGEFKKELARTDPHFSKLQGSADGAIIKFRKMDDTTKSLGQRLRDVAVISGGAVLAFRALSGASNNTLGSIIRVNAEMERLRYQLAGLSDKIDPNGAMQDAVKQISALQDLATKTPFALQELTNSFVKMRVAGIEDTNKALRILTDGVAAFGGNEESLHRITLGITQMSGKGVIQMEELRQQLGESMPSAMKLMARSMGVSMGDLTKAIATGRVDAQVALKKWFEEVDLTYGGSGERMMKTFSGQLALIKTNFNKLISAEDSQIRVAFDKLKVLMGEFASFLGTVEAKTFFDTMGRGMQSLIDLTERVGKAVYGLSDYFREFSGVIKIALGATLFKMVMGGFTSMMNQMRVGLVGAVSSVNALTNAYRTMGRASQQAMSSAAAAQLASAGAVANSMAKRNAAQGMVGASSLLSQGGSAMALMGGMGARIAGLTRAGGALVGVLSKGIAFLGPLGLAIATLGPIAWEVGKAVWSWWKGADKATDAVKGMGESTLDALRQTQQATRAAVSEQFDKQIRDLEAKTKALQEAQKEIIQQGQQMIDVDRDRIVRKGERRISGDLRAIERLERLVEASPENLSFQKVLDQKREDLEDSRKMLTTELAAFDEQSRTRMAEYMAANRNASLNTMLETIKTFVSDKAKALAELDKQEKEQLSKVLDDVAEERFDGAEERVKDKMRSISAVYDKAVSAAEKKRDDEKKKAQAENRSSKQADDGFHRAKRAATEERIRDEMNLWKTEREAALARVRNGQASMLEVEKFDDKLAELQDRLKKVSGTEYMIELLSQTESDEKKMERLAKTLEDARDKVKELEAELIGSSGAMAKLVGQIKRGDFGNLEDGTEITNKMRQELIETTLAAEVLKGVLEDINSVKSDYDRLIENQRERKWRAEAVIAGVNPEDEVAYQEFKYQNGYLEVTGDAAVDVQRKVGELTQGIEIAEGTVIRLGEALQKKAFGNATLEAINAVIGAIASASQSFAALGSFMQNPLGAISGMASGVLGTVKGVFNGEMSASGVQKQVWDFFASKGFAPHQIAGIMGNIHAESGFNPTARQKGGGGGTGLFQHDDRAPALLSHIGGNLSDVQGQLEFAWKELNTTERRALNLLMNAKNEEEATQAFLAFERPQGYSGANPQNSLHYDRRLGGAQAAMRAFGGAQGNSNITVDPTLTDHVQDAYDTQVQPRRQTLNDSEASVVEAERRAARVQWMRDTEADYRSMIVGSEINDDENGRLAKLIEQITSGELGASTDWKDPIYAELVEKAKEFDERQRSITENRKLDKDIESDQEKIAENRVDLTQREADQRERMKDPNYKGQSSDMRQLIEDTDKYLAKVAERYGIESAIYKQEKARIAEQRTQLARAEGTDSLIQLKSEAEAAERSAMTQRDQAKADYDQRINELTSLRDHAIRMGADRAQAEQLYARAAAAEWKKYQEEFGAGLSKQISEMSDARSQIDQAAVNWTTGLSDAIYASITGEVGAFESLRDKIREDLAKALINSATATIVKPFQNFLEGENGLGAMIQGWIDSIYKRAGAGFGGAASPGAPAGGGWFSQIFSNLSKWIASIFQSFSFPTKHTGGIVGHGGGGSKFASAAVFAGAPRFHTGGIVKSTGFKSGLLPGEVPIIAQRGEGVFTKDQMKALGGVGGSSININSPVTVNATGGTPEQNADLAAQIAKQHERAMRGLIQDELVRQMRPGNALSRR